MIIAWSARIEIDPAHLLARRWVHDKAHEFALARLRSEPGSVLRRLDTCLPRA